MARTNKYASINFNEVYGNKKQIKPNPSPSPTPPATRPHGSMLVLTRPSKHTQPNNPNQPTTPSPQSNPPKPTNPTHLPDSPTPTSQPQQNSPPTESNHDSPDSISLRPLYHSLPSAQILAESVPEPDLPETQQISVLSRSVKKPEPETHEISVLNRPVKKPEPFVPPHLRPGFNGRGSQDTEDPRKTHLGFRPNSRDLRKNSSFLQNRDTIAGQFGEQTRPKSGDYERRLPEISTNGSNSGGWSSNPWPESKPRPNSGGGRPQFHGSHRSPPQRDM